MAEKSPSALKHDAYAAVRLPPFRAFLTGRLCMTLGIQISSVIVGWQVYLITKDPLAVGLIGFAEVIPAFIVALYAGHLADTYNRKNIILWFTALLLFSVAALCAISSRIDLLTQYGVFPIYAIVAVMGVARGFLTPAIFAFQAEIVPRELYPNSSAWNSTSWHIGAVAGPAIGGLVYAKYGAVITYLLATGLVAASWIIISTVKGKPHSRIRREERFLDTLFSGINFVFRHQVILAALSLDLFAVLFGGVTAMLPFFSGNILHGDAEELGLLRAAPAVGSIITAFILAYYPPMRNSGKKLFTAVALFGLCMISFALSKNFYLSFAMLAFSGMADNVSVVTRSTILQLLTPDNMRGRVSAVNSIFIGSSNELGEMESGIAGKIMGIIPSVIFGGIMTIGVVGGTMYFAPKLKKLELKDLKLEGENAT